MPTAKAEKNKGSTQPDNKRFLGNDYDLSYSSYGGGEEKPESETSSQATEKKDKKIKADKKKH